ncbi:MAG: hypothetical protein ABIF19_00745 [Planctomycetota bacterium]
MASSAAAIWSAIAATFSAIAAITIMRIQRLNMLDSARPELILMGWDRKIKQIGDLQYDIVTIKKIKNVGKGSASHLTINSSKTIKDKLLSALSTVTISILPANEEYEINGEISLSWDHAPTDDRGGKYLEIDIVIHSWCSRGYRHETIYKLFAVDRTQNVSFLGGDEDEIAPGVMLSLRKTISESVWRLKLNRKLSRLPIIRKYSARKN